MTDTSEHHKAVDRLSPMSMTTCQAVDRDEPEVLMFAKRATMDPAGQPSVRPPGLRALACEPYRP